mmetsp:Transcript_96227/g.223097  ORF Transcript_96227/g.223097 Transcript_96227/m.223097 type:complete len:86 (+) Transcript_96227:51-308(+)
MNAATSACRGRGHWDWALWTLGWMQRGGVVGGMITFDIMVRSLEQGSLWDVIPATFEEVHSQACKLILQAFSPDLKAEQRLGDEA